MISRETYWKRSPCFAFYLSVNYSTMILNLILAMIGDKAWMFVVTQPNLSVPNLLAQFYATRIWALFFLFFILIFVDLDIITCQLSVVRYRYQNVLPFYWTRSNCMFFFFFFLNSCLGFLWLCNFPPTLLQFAISREIIISRVVSLLKPHTQQSSK